MGGELPTALDRRSFLAAGLATMAALPLGGCGSSAGTQQTAIAATPRRGAMLLAYFSRPGENYWNGGRRDLKVGNTEVLARKIRQRLKCDVHRIQAADPYPDDYDQTVARNVREQDADARPAIADPLASIDRYDTILLASPIWNVRPPMIMDTFADRFDFSGKRVLPVVTYAVSGLGDAPQVYSAACPGARIGAGLAVRGEEVRTAAADRALGAWLRRTALEGGRRLPARRQP